MQLLEWGSGSRRGSRGGLARMSPRRWWSGAGSLSHEQAMAAVEDPRDDTSVLHIEGPLRAPASGELRQDVEALLRAGKRNIVVNLARVSDVDAAGLGALVAAYNAAIAANGVLRITDAFGTARELLSRVGLLDLLNDERERDHTPTSPDRADPPERPG